MRTISQWQPRLPTAMAVSLALLMTMSLVGAVDTQAAPFAPNQIGDMVLDTRGTLYFSNTELGQVTAVSATGATVVAHSLDRPTLLAVDLRRNVYVYLERSSSVVKISPQGQQRTLAKRLHNVRAMAADRDGMVYVLLDTGDVRLLGGDHETLKKTPQEYLQQTTRRRK